MLSPDAAPETARELPTADDLAELHGEDELVRLKHLALSLGDSEASALFEAAVFAARKREIQCALDRPRERREQEAAWAKRRAAEEQWLVPRAHRSLAQQMAVGGQSPPACDGQSVDQPA